MAREIPYIAAINEAIHQEMQRDESVILIGQNIATTDDDPFLQAFGADRVRVTPISETAEIGMATGAALAGYRPVVELYMAEFMLVAMNQVVNEAPRFRYMTGGQVKVPLVLKAGYGFTAGWAGQHTGSIYGMFMGVPGLKVALPATPADAKGLMATSIRDDNPVCFFHHYLLTLDPGDVPEGEHLVPFGEAAIRREGDDVTIVATGWTLGKALTAAERLAGEGVSAEVIDPRTLEPLDTKTILESVEKTGRLVLVDQATRHASASAVIAGEVAEQGFSSLKAPIRQVTALDATIPYSQPMEEYLLPDEDKIVDAVQQVLGHAPVGGLGGPRPNCIRSSPTTSRPENPCFASSQRRYGLSAGTRWLSTSVPAPARSATSPTCSIAVCELSRWLTAACSDGWSGSSNLDSTHSRSMTS
jgi:acetoin:2,6-dichlorophenolindophenol oxidoreductase subunit beta